MRVPWYLMAKGKGGGGYKTASGPIVSVNDALAAPLRSLLVNIDPVQDLHGYDSPWPAGGGKQLYNSATFSTITSGTITCTNNGDGSFTFNADEADTVDRFFDIFNNQFDKNAGGTPLPSAEYRLTGTPSGGSLNTYTMYARPTYPRDTGNGITFTDSVTGGSILIKAGYRPQNLVFRPMIRLASNGDDTFAPYSNICPISGWDAVNVWNKPTYDPTANPTVTIQLGQTVYGGTLDVTNGVLTVDRAMVNISDLSWSYASNYSYMQTQDLVNEVARPESNTTPLDGLLCSAYKTATAQQAGSGNVNATIAGDTYGGLRIKDNAYTDVATWLATAGNEKIVYPLATPITIPLTPTEISTLQGQNNVWADTGDVTVEYLSAGGADPDLMKLAVAFMGRK